MADPCFGMGQSFGSRRKNCLVILNNMEKILSALDDLKAAEAAREVADTAENALLTTISTQLATLIANSNGAIAASDVEAVVTSINTFTAAQAAFVAANTPAAPPTTPPPTA